VLNLPGYVQFVLKMELFIISTYHTTKNLFVFGKRMIKTDSAQRSSNKCKKYLPKNYSQHGNILNAI